MRLPAEWEPQRAVWLIWPGNPETWRYHRKEVEHDFALLVAVCSQIQHVELICTTQWKHRCLQSLKNAGANMDQIHFHDWPVHDAWARDVGPVFLKNGSQNEAVDLPFNSWGGKFPVHKDDDQLAQRISDVRNMPCRRFPIFGEGGGVESNGQGIFLLTENVWMNPNRNPGKSREEIEEAFRSYFGITEIIWLRAGMSSDDTDGHVDTLARFVNPTTVIVPFPGVDDPDRKQLLENRQRLADQLEVIDFPHPKLPDQPASYMNSVFLNQTLLVPTYGVPEDTQAMSRYQTLFPERQVIGIPSSVFLIEGGALHCLTLNEWA